MGTADDLREQGPLVVGQLMAHGAATVPITVHLLVDTGAALSGIDQDVAEALHLVPREFAPIRGVTQHELRVPIFEGELALWFEGDGPPRSVRVRLRLAGLPASRSEAYQGVLGRDFLEQFRLLYDGPDGRFELHDRA